MKCISVGAQVFHAEKEAVRQTDINNEINSRLCSFQIASIAYKLCCGNQNPSSLRTNFNARQLAK
jgi:hypothetical protein